MNGLALAMGGGGARGAYQVGFLRTLARHYPELSFPIVTGVSAGAINALYLGSHTGSLEECAAGLTEVWRNLEVDHVFDSNTRGLLSSVFRWTTRLAMGGSKRSPRTRGLVDTAPLRKYLEQSVQSHGAGLDGIQANLDSGKLQALGLTSTCYGTGRSITWVQGNQDVPMWKRPQRLSVRTKLSVNHAMASSSLPMFFPAIQVGDHWHGDGGIRLTAPLSPALHLGAERILAVSTRYKSSAEVEPVIVNYPPPAQVLGVMLNAVFLDMLDYDAATMERVNKLLKGLPKEEHGELRPMKLFVLRPSEDLGRLAGQYEPQLKGLFRWLTRGTGTRETKSPDSLSMLMFQPDYIGHLIELGERDAEQARESLERFLSED